MRGGGGKEAGERRLVDLGAHGAVRTAGRRQRFEVVRERTRARRLPCARNSHVVNAILRACELQQPQLMAASARERLACVPLRQMRSRRRRGHAAWRASRRPCGDRLLQYDAIARCDCRHRGGSTRHPRDAHHASHVSEQLLPVGPIESACPIRHRHSLVVGDVGVDVGAQQQLQRGQIPKRANVVHQRAPVAILPLEVKSASAVVDPARARENQREHRPQQPVRLREERRHQLRDGRLSTGATASLHEHLQQTQVTLHQRPLLSARHIGVG
mmetsp:Transcript_5257/g.12074  ORF Transcript_5257/g.12074 Transcript_5257/m.12074 type:complete len:272 (+) Transcript_5257:502-1317(+)